MRACEKASFSQSNSFEIASKMLLEERKPAWLRSKGTIFNDIFQVIYVLKIIYEVGN